MKYINLIGAVGVAALSIGSAMAESATTVTHGDEVTAITAAGDWPWPTNSPPPPLIAPSSDGFAKRDYTITYTADAQTVTESDTTWTMPATTMTLTMGGGFLTPPPPMAAATNIVNAPDATSISFSTETTTYTEVVPATTIGTGTDAVTFSAWTEVITWTKLDTFHVTVPGGYAKRTAKCSPTQTTFETIVTTSATSSPLA